MFNMIFLALHTLFDPFGGKETLNFIAHNKLRKFASPFRNIWRDFISVTLQIFARTWVPEDRLSLA